MISHGCAEPVEVIGIRFSIERGQYCAAIEDSSCHATCEDALQFAAIRAGEIIDRSCPDSPEPQELPPTRPSHQSERLQLRTEVRRAAPALHLVTPLALAENSNIRADLMVATLESTGHHKRLDGMAVGFITGVGLSSGGTQVALIGGLADINSGDWYWRAGLELCRGYRHGPWEWSGCFALGGGQIYRGPYRDSGYPWMSVSQSVRVDLTAHLKVRLDFGAQVSVAEPWFGLEIVPQWTFNPMATLGVQYTIPEIRKCEGAACR